MATEYIAVPAMEQEVQNKATVEALYDALKHADTEMNVAHLLASDLEWWFHGPPCCEHMMRLLTGKSVRLEFMFEPRSMTSIGEKVIVEGWEGDRAYWVHVWSLKDGVITQFREYFNTWLTVRDLRSGSTSLQWKASKESQTIWQSEPREHIIRSLPGLLLAL